MIEFKYCRLQVAGMDHLIFFLRVYYHSMHLYKKSETTSSSSFCSRTTDKKVQKRDNWQPLLVFSQNLFALYQHVTASFSGIVCNITFKINYFGIDSNSQLLWLILVNNQNRLINYL